METGSDLKTDLPERLTQRGGCLDAARWSIEGCEESIPGGVELSPCGTARVPDERWRDGAPRSSRQAVSPSRAASSVEPTMSVNRTVASTRSVIDASRQAGGEACGLGHRRLVGFVVDPGVQAIDGGKVDDLRTADPLGRVMGRTWERWPRQDERRDAHGAEDVTHVELHRGPERRHGRARAQAPAHVPHEPVMECRV